MKDLIEALQIFSKYTNSKWPTHCEHDELGVNVDPRSVSEEDTARLDELSFTADEDKEMFISFRFGSC